MVTLDPTAVAVYFFTCNLEIPVCPGLAGFGERLASIRLALNPSNQIHTLLDDLSSLS